MFKYKCVNSKSLVKNLKTLFAEWNLWGMENVNIIY